MSKKPLTAERLVLRWTLDALNARRDLCFVFRNNVGAVRIDNARFVRFGMPGAADIVGLSKNGKFIAVECKSSSGRLSEAQAAFKCHVEKMGGLYFTVAGSGDIENMIRALEAA